MKKLFLIAFLLLSVTWVFAQEKKENFVAQDQQNALHMEGVTEDVMPYTGKLLKNYYRLFGDPVDFTTLENFRYKEFGVVTRKGMADYTSDTSSDVVKFIPFVQDIDNDQFILAARQDTDTKYVEIDGGSFGSVEYTSTGTGHISYAYVRDTIIIADGDDIWGYVGDETYPSALLHEATGSDVYMDVYDWIYDGDSHSIVTGDSVWFGYTRPFDAVQEDSDDGYEASSSSDTTPALKGGKWLYWEERTAVAADTIENPKIQCDGRAITGNLWDSIDWMFPRLALFQKTSSDAIEDYSYFVRNSSQETYMDISEMESTGQIYLSFPYRPYQVKLFFPETNKNDNASTLTVEYWDGDSWEDITVTDGTLISGGSATFEETGVLTWSMPSDWETREYSTDHTYNGYAIKLTVSATIDNYVRMYKVVGIPYPDDINEEAWEMVGAYRNRLVLANGYDRSLLRISETNQPDTFCGPDSTYVQVGERDETMGLVEMESGLLIMKSRGNYFLTGATPSTFYVKQIKGTVPATSKDSIVPIETPDGVVVFYQGADGIYYLTSEGKNVKVSAPVEAYWQDGHDLEIPDAEKDDTFGYYDKPNNEVAWLISSGSGVTDFNYELVYSLTYNKWSVFARQSADQLRAAIGFTDYDDDRNEWHLLGSASSGQVYTLESGEDDDGTSITCVVVRKPMILSGRLGKSELVGLALYYDIPDYSTHGNDVTLALDVTPGISTSDTVNDVSATLDDTGFWFTKATESTNTRQGYYHIIDMEFTGRIALFADGIWSREAPWSRE